MNNKNTKQVGNKTREYMRNICLILLVLLLSIQAASAVNDATGGTITDYNGYRYHTFTSNETFTPSGNLSVEYLIVAGGGGGGGEVATGAGASGGGAGGFLNNTINITAQAYNIVVGTGGTGGTARTIHATNGSNSSFNSLVAIGGGHGDWYGQTAGSGGSGGGSPTSGTKGTGTIGQGTDGGTFSGTGSGSAGGGGNGSVGSNDDGASKGGNGGSGGTWNGTCYAGGGAGGSYYLTGGTATCGGGAGGQTITGSDGVNGTANTGGGGGGATVYTTGDFNGGNGGSGIVIIRYAYILPTYIPNSPINLTNTTGSNWVNYSWQPDNNGNITDSYNVSINGVFSNQTIPYYNFTGLNGGSWANITIKSINTSGTGLINATGLSDNIQTPSQLQYFSTHLVINFTNPTPSDNYQVELRGLNGTIPNIMWNVMNHDGNDTRFVLNNTITELNHWTREIKSSSDYSIYVLIPTAGTTKIDWYVGNSSAISTSNFALTFPKFNDNAEKGSTSDWTIGDDAGMWIESSLKKSGNYSYKINGTNATAGKSTKEAKRGFTTRTDNFTFEADAYIQYPYYAGADYKPARFIMLEQSGGTSSNSVYGFFTNMLNGGNEMAFQYYDTTSHNVSTILPNPAWYHIKYDIFPATSKFNIYLERNQSSIQQVSNAGTVGTISNVGQVAFMGDSIVNTTTDVLYVDNIFMKEYNNNVFLANFSSSNGNYIPPSPINLTNTTGNFWINYSWDAGSGYITDSFNKNINGIWTNDSTKWINTSVNPHGWVNISVYSVNSSNNSINSTPLTGNFQVTNNVPTQSNIGNKNATVGVDLEFTILITDADTDKLNFISNNTNASFSYNVFLWTPKHSDIGNNSWNITINDGYGGIIYENIYINVTSHYPWEYGWNNNSKATLTLTNATNITHQRVKLNQTYVSIPVNMWNVMNQNGNDSLFTSLEGDSFYPYWIDYINSTNNYSIWVNIAENNTTQLTWWYKNPSASSNSSGNSTFSYFNQTTPFLVTSQIVANSNPWEAYGKVITMPNGSIFTAWTSGTNENSADNTIRTSRYINGSWTTPYTQITNTGKADVTPFFLVNGNTVHLFWVRINSLYDNTTVMEINTTNNGSTWSSPRIIKSGGWNIPMNNGIKLRDGKLIIPFGYMIAPYAPTTWDTYSTALVSSDGGTTWIMGSPVPDDGFNDEPSIIELTNGSLYMTIRSGNASESHQRYSISTDDGMTWSKFAISNAQSPQAPATLLRTSFNPNSVYMLVDDAPPTNRYPLVIYTLDEDTLTWTNKRTIRATYAEYPGMTISGDNLMIVSNYIGDGGNKFNSDLISESQYRFLNTYNSLPVLLQSINLFEKVPPIPVIGTVSTGNFYINTTWQAGAGNITNSYNVSTNGIWNNGSSNTYINSTLSAHVWHNLTIYAWNNSGTLSTTALTNNTQIPNNVPNLASIGNKNADEGTWLNFTLIGSDIDGDSLTYATNASKGTLNGANFNWSISYADSGTYYWKFNTTDNFSAVATETITVIVSDLNIMNLTYSNNKTNSNSLSFTINTSEPIKFNATANQTITTWNWAINGSDQLVNFDNFTTSFFTMNTRNVSVNATNANGTSSTIYWDVNVQSLVIYQNSSLINNVTSVNVSYNRTLTANDVAINATMYTTSGTNSITVHDWNSTYKKWNTSGTASTYYLGDFFPNTVIQIKKDLLNWNKYTSDGNGYITFTYSGSPAQFESRTAPVIQWYNDVFGIYNQLTITTLVPTIHFNVTTDQTLDYIDWKLNGISVQNSSSLNFNYTFSGTGTSVFSVQGTNSNATSNFANFSVVRPEGASSTSGGGDGGSTTVTPIATTSMISSTNGISIKPATSPLTISETSKGATISLRNDKNISQKYVIAYELNDIFGKRIKAEAFTVNIPTSETYKLSIDISSKIDMVYVLKASAIRGTETFTASQIMFKSVILTNQNLTIIAIMSVILIIFMYIKKLRRKDKRF